MNKVIIERGEYNGYPTVNIRWADGEPGKYPICFGAAYAKLLLQALKEQPDFLEKFLEETKPYTMTPNVPRPIVP